MSTAAYRSASLARVAWLLVGSLFLPGTARAQCPDDPPSQLSNGCLGGDFGDDCSLAELLYDNNDSAWIRVGDVEFNSFQYSDPFVTDLSQIRVEPVGSGSNRPGVRLVPNPRVWSDDTHPFGELWLAAASGFAANNPALRCRPVELVEARYHVQVSQVHRINPDTGQFEGGMIEGHIEVFESTGGLTERDYGVPAIRFPGFGSPLGTVSFDSPSTPILSIFHEFQVSGEVTDLSPLYGLDLAEIHAIEYRVTVAGAPPPPDPAADSGMIDNGLFDEGPDGLEGWECTGPGSCGVMDTSTQRPAALTTTDVAPTSLSRVITTPLSSFMIFFDAQFMTQAGSLDVLIDDTVIARIEAPSELDPAFDHHEILVNDPALMGLDGATLEFRVNPGSLADILLANILSPFLRQPEGIVEVIGAAELDGVRIEQSDAEGTAATVSFVAMGSNAAFAESEASGVVALAGLTWGNLVRARSELGFESPSATSSTRGDSVYTLHSPVSLADLDYRLRVHGSVELDGDTEACATANLASGDCALLLYSMFAWVIIERATTQNLALEGSFAVDPDGMVDRGGFSQVPTCEDEPPLVFARVPGSDPPRYEVDYTFCVEDALWVRAGSVVGAHADVFVGADASSVFDGLVTGDFVDTTTMTLSSDTPGVELIPLGGDGANQPPIADAGTDQLVPATGPEGAPVTLDGGDSSDPDGDELSYTWTGFFGAAAGPTPTVTLPLGTHVVVLTVSDGTFEDSDEVSITVEDITPPVVTAPPDLVVTASGPVTVVDLELLGQATALDGVDGILVPSPDSDGMLPPGVTVVTWIATDAAGNEGFDTQLVEILFDVVGFFPPVTNPPGVNRARPGRSVPIKWVVTDGLGGYIRDLDVVETLGYSVVDCADGDVGEAMVDADDAGQSGLRYDVDDEHYVYVWQTPAGLADHCVAFVLGLADDTQRLSLFELR